ncbi:MAG: glycosyltransferase family 4 protein [Actinomycetota bacterium]
MRRGCFVVPGGLERVTGGNVYDAVVIDELRGRDWDVDVVEAEDVDDSFDVVVVDSLAFRFGRPQIRTPYIALVHQLPSAAAGFPEPSVQERDTLRFADRVIVVASWLVAELSRFTDAAVDVIEPGRDRAWAVDGARPDGSSVLCVANAVPGKGVPDAIEAFSRRAPGEATLTLIGDLTVDPEEAERIDTAVAASSRAVERAGVLEPAQLADRYANARVLLSPTRYEGRPIAVAEAMASGMPVVGYDVPGMRELVRPGRDGLLARPGDLDELAGCLADLLETPGLAEAMSLAARRRALDWPTWKETARRFADVLEGGASRTGAQDTVAR